jgi:hypothetical protein
MPITLATLFTSPQDVWDLLSTEGVDLREDDHSLASGQIIQTTTDTPVGATTMAVLATPVALLNGAQLTFDGAGMPVPATVQLTAAAVAGSTSLSIAQMTYSGYDIPAGAQARDSGVNAATGARLLVGARKGTSKVKLWCNARYDDSQLKLSGTVLDWATAAAARFLCMRRAQACPKGVQGLYDEAIEEMRMVQSGALSIEDIGTRGVDWPTVTNITVNAGYDYMRSRVEPNISEQTPTAYNQYIDWNSAVSLDF